MFDNIEVFQKKSFPQPMNHDAYVWRRAEWHFQQCFDALKSKNTVFVNFKLAMIMSFKNSSYAKH